MGYDKLEKTEENKLMMMMMDDYDDKGNDNSLFVKFIGSRPRN
jgi:hypothetical protein